MVYDTLKTYIEFKDFPVVDALPANKDRCSFLKKDEDDLLVVKVGQILRLRTTTSAKDDTVLGKRQSDVNP